MNIKGLFILVSSAFLLVSCNQKQIDELNEKNNALSNKSASKDSTINQLLSSFNQIETNLNEIKKREGILKVNVQGENIGNNAGDRIAADIEMINSLMKQNEELTLSLNKRLKQSGIKIAEFQNLVDGLNIKLDNKNQEIAFLNKELQEKKILIGQLYFRNDSLTYINKVKDEEIKQKIDKLNEGFYAYGTFKELKEKNVLTKEGGFLGIGKNKELKNDFNKNYFSRIDIRKQNSFLIYAKKAKLITKHPEDSYQLMGTNGKVDSLVITDVDQFWDASRYLVIVVD